MWKTLSLKQRLTTALAAWVMAGFIAGYFILSAVFAAYVDKQFQDELGIHVKELRRITVEEPDGGLRLASQFSDPRYDELDSGYYWQVRVNEDAVLYSPSLAGRKLNIPPDKLATNTIPHNHELEGPTGKLLLLENVIPKGPNRELRFIVGMDERLRNAQIGEFNRMLAVALIGFGFALVAAAYVLIQLGLAPLEMLTTQLRKLRTGEIALLEGEHPTEISPLVGELNALVQSGRDNLQKARGQAGRLAHGLKTPLAVIMDEAYRLEDVGQADSARTIAEQSRAMQAQIDQHIARARASAVVHLPGVRSNVEPIMRDVTNALMRLNSGKDVDVEFGVPHDLCAALDAQDLSEVLGCAVDNAFHHARNQLRLMAKTADRNKIAIFVEDDGEGLPPEARDYVFQPGARLDESRPGSGLGLSIVKEIVELYGGSCWFDESELGGARLSILFPAA